VAAILARQNQHLEADEDAFANIKKFQETNCCAIVTGQQVGLFGGPLFTVFKTLAAVRLAHALTAKGLNIVPIFWINDIDHDFEEVGHCRVLDEARGVVEVHYQPAPQFAGMPVGHVRIGPEIEESLQALEAALPQTPFRDELMARLRDAYRTGYSFARGFSRTLLHMFRGHGLILMDPLDSEFQQIAAPVYRQAIEESEVLNQALCDRSQELLAAGYHAQIHTEPSATLLFAMLDGKRCAVQRVNGGFQLKGTGYSCSADDLLRMADEETYRFSPNVSLRPVIQDYLLPTAAYVGGPAEVAYFAQLAPLYNQFGRPMPVIFPRPSFTLIEPAILDISDRYQFELTDFMAAETEVLVRAFNRRIPLDIAAALKAVEEGVPSELEDLRPALAELDPTLGEALDRAQQKIAHHLAALRTKLVHAEVRGHQELAREMRSCLIALYPDQGLQERQVSILSFLARYGPTLIQRLYEQTDLSCPDHRIIVL
jgi:bacillithiol biosynthesis cysteine-adding enzyme BshC